MSDLITGDGRTHVQSGLMRESLVSSKLIASTHSDRVRGMVPNVKMLCVGAQSIMDRGAESILPLVEMIATLNKDHRMVIGVGGGARSRHTLSVGMDLGLPMGGLARIVGGVEEQNRDILQFLLAPHGGITLVKDHFQDLQLFLGNGLIPICIGQPPYHFWEPPAEKGSLPDNGPDVGLFLQAELIGMAELIYIKDVDGVYTRDPHKYDDGEFISEISAQALLDMQLEDLPIERELLKTLENARMVTSFQIINGLKPENLQRAINGEHVGTRIYASKTRKQT